MCTTMKCRKIFLNGFLSLICFFLLGCDAQSRTLENGYTLPKATKENVQKIIDSAVQNLVFVKGGSYMMGDSGYIYKGERVYWSLWLDNFPAHKVTLDSFSMSKYEVTYWEYDVYTDLFNNEPVSLKVGHQYFRKGNYPVGKVTWQQADEYCKWLGEKTGLPFSLPTEAQWEYAARSRGKQVGYATDNGKMEPGRNYRKSGDLGTQIVFPVGTFPPNPLGLHDMAGNHSEWVLDWYDKKYYEKSPELNPQGPETGTYKVLRSGAPNATPSTVTVYSRRPHQVVFDKDDTSLRTMYYFGFRCVVNSLKPINR